MFFWNNNLRGKKFRILALISLLLFLPLSPVKALDYSASPASANPAGAGAASGTFSTGSLVNDGGTIYFISGGIKIPFTNWQAFVGLGFSAKNVVNGDTSAYSLSQNYSISSAQQDHPWGSWLLYKGTVYYYDQDGMIPAPSSEVFTSNGGSWNLVLPANQYDLAALTKNPNLAPLSDSDSRLSPPLASSAPASTGLSGTSGVSDPFLPAGLTDNPDAAALNASLPQTDSSGQSFGFLGDQAVAQTATSTATSTTAGVPPSATTTPASGSIPAAPSSVIASTPSQPKITLPSSAAAGLPVTVTASASDPNGSPLSYVFNWGDGSAPTTASSASASHTYTAAGNYIVSVTAVNSSGMISSQTINITVGPAQ